MDLSNVRAVLFDLDGTLYYQLPLRILMALELGTLPVNLGSMKKTRSVLQTIKQFRSMREDLRHLGNPSDLLDELQYRQAAAAVGGEATEVKRIVCEWMYHRPLKYLKWCRRKGAATFFAEAQRRGLKLGVFSDYPAQEKLKALGLDSYVQLVLCVLQIRKLMRLSPILVAICEPVSSGGYNLKKCYMLGIGQRLMQKAQRLQACLV